MAICLLMTQPVQHCSAWYPSSYWSRLYCQFDDFLCCHWTLRLHRDRETHGCFLVVSSSTDHLTWTFRDVLGGVPRGGEGLCVPRVSGRHEGS